MKFRSCFGVLFIASLILMQHGSSFAISVDTIKFHSSVKEGAIFRWKIETVKTVDDQTSWQWEWANYVTLNQNEYISMEWLSNPDETTEIDVLGPIRYDVVTKVGSRTLNFSKDESFFNFLIAPLYVRNKLGEIEAGLDALERLWFNTYKLPNAYLPPSYSDYIWDFDMQNATLRNTGENAIESSIVFGQITTQKFYETNNPEIYVFDVAYDSITGFVKWLKYPSIGQFIFPVANNTHDITEGLDELLITYSDIVTNSNFEVVVILAGFTAILITIVVFLLRKERI